MTVTNMIREPDVEVTNPTVDEVHALLAKVASDEGEPLVVLKMTELESKVADAIELWIARLNVANVGTLGGWLVRYKRGENQPSLVLATQLTGKELFDPYELFGAFELVRRECSISQGILHEAIRWFLSNGTPCPSLTWLEFRDCVRSA